MLTLCQGPSSHHVAFGGSVIGVSGKSREELLGKLEEARGRVKKLEELLVESTGRGVLVEHQEAYPYPYAHDDELPEVDSFESTETLDLTSLFSKDVTSSGSYYTRRIGKTLFGRLLEALPIPAFLVAGSTHVVFANRAWGRIFPAYEKAVGKSVCDLVRDASAAKHLDVAISQVFASRRVLCKKVVLRLDGCWMCGRMTLRSIRLGPQRLLLALVEDLTEEHTHQAALRREIDTRQKVERALRENRQRLDLAFSEAGLFAWDWEVETGAVHFDRRFPESLGYGQNEIEPRMQSWEALVHPDDRPGVAASIRRHFRGDSDLLEQEFRIRVKSGEWKWILSRGKITERDLQGQPLRVLGINLDITERKQSEERVQFLTHAMIQAVERDRERTSLDLHDQVAQDLAAVRIALETILPSLISAEPDVASTISNASKKVRDVIQTVRAISYNLRPAGLDRLGLISATRQYCENFSEEHAVRAEFFTSGMEKFLLDFDTEINLFRVIQESLNNVSKHAKATTVTVRLVGSAGQISLTVEDDGCGFDRETALADELTGQQMGLWCMEQRVGLLRGTLTIRSTRNEGTRILAEIPYKGDHSDDEKRLDSG